MKTVPSDRPTLKAVADAAGVSIATASRVLAGKSASPRSVAAVQAASRRLGYRPNPIARALRARATGTVGVVVPELRNPFFADLIAALEDTAQTEHFGVLVADSHGDAAHERHRLETLLDRRVDGLLVVPADEHQSADALREAAAVVPVVQIDRYVAGLDVDFVGVDNHRGVAELLDDLRALGCRQLRFVSATTTNSTARARRDAFDTFSRDRGFEVLPHLLGDFSIGFGRQVATDVAAAPLPDALVCGSDVIAVGLVSELTRLGVRVPEDTLVTGFDDIVLAGLVSPGLTTLRQPVDAIAKEAVTRLLARLRHPAEPSRQSVILPHLVRRGSTARSQVEP